MKLFRCSLVPIVAAGALAMADAGAESTGKQAAAATQYAMALDVVPDRIRTELAVPPSPAAVPHPVASAATGASQPQARAKRSANGVLVPMDAVPKPADWVKLLSGFLAMAFIARRRAMPD